MKFNKILLLTLFLLTGSAKPESGDFYKKMLAMGAVFTTGYWFQKTIKAWQAKKQLDELAQKARKFVNSYGVKNMSLYLAMMGYIDNEVYALSYLIDNGKESPYKMVERGCNQTLSQDTLKKMIESRQKMLDFLSNFNLDLDPQNKIMFNKRILWGCYNDKDLNQYMNQLKKDIKIMLESISEAKSRQKEQN